ncbi:MAG: insulinase family protein [Bryobacterales bacterium]|nr:insulinase family protein [Bryobacterales bacterium]
MTRLLSLLVLCALTLGAAELKIPIEKYKLKNGLTVLLSQDNAVPVVAVYVLYGVGARSEEKGRSGFAHLFEHMMFQGSANAPKGVHFQTVEANGGNLNGSTHPDYTDYYETLPSNKLAVALWLESDRMRSLAITEENLANQKEAVKQERRLNFDNQPYVTAIVDVFPTLMFQNWANNHSLIGSFEDLNAATVGDVSKFFKTHYAPNNAILTIVGDINKPEAKKWIEQYFGDIPSQSQPPKPNLSEPAVFKAQTTIHKDQHAPVPAIVMGYPGPKRATPDFYALTMADIILTGGESSRLHQALVKEKKSVLSVEAGLGWPFGGPIDYQDPGIYGVQVTASPAVPSNEIVAQYEAEIEKLRQAPVTAAELDRARAILRSYRIRSLQSPLSRAQMITQHEYFDGSAERVNTELDKFLAVTPAQVQAAVKKYLPAEQRSVLEVVPAPKAQPKKEAK